MAPSGSPTMAPASEPTWIPITTLHQEGSVLQKTTSSSLRYSTSSSTVNFIKSSENFTQSSFNSTSSTPFYRQEYSTPTPTSSTKSIHFTNTKTTTDIPANNTNSLEISFTSAPSSIPPSSSVSPHTTESYFNRTFDVAEPRDYNQTLVDQNSNFTDVLGPDVGSGYEYPERGNQTSIFQDENLLPVKFINFLNDTLEESGSGSGSGFWEENLTDLLNQTDIMDRTGYETTPNTEALTLLYYSLGEMIIVSILLGILTLWTIFGNFLVLVSLWKFKPLRSMSNLLIGNLAVCDLLLALTVLPMSVVNDVLGHWVFGEVLCNIWLSTDVLYCTASIWSLCVIAMDRFTATQFPVWYRNKRSLRRAITYMVIVWVFSIVVTVPPLFGWQDKSLNYQYSNKTDTYMCVLFTNMEYVIYSASGSFIIPLFVQLTLYAKIFMILRERTKQLSRAYKQRNQQKRAPEKVSIRVPPREIELSQVSHNEDSKYLFCEESSPDYEMKSDIDDEEVSVAIIDTDRCLYQKHPQDTSTHGLLEKTHRNGVSNTDATDSDTLVIHNPTTRLAGETTDKESQSDQEKVTLMRKKKIPEEDAHSNGGHKSKTFTVAIKHANPFKREKLRTSLRKFDKREQRATQRMGIIISCFAICWLPFLFMYLIRSLCSSCPELNPHAQAFLIWLGYANSGLNPILYTIFNDDFRQAFYKLVCCCLAKPKTTPQQL